MRVTSPPRTICDLAGDLDPAALELLLDHALARRRVTVAGVAGALEALADNVRGAGTLRRLLAARPDSRALAESPLEQRLHALLRRAKLFRGARPQHRVGGHRVDLAYPDAKLALEVDSFRHHSSRSDWSRDRTRHAASSSEAGACSP